MKRKYWIILAVSILALLLVVYWPTPKPDRIIPSTSEIVGMLQAQSQVASTEVTIRKMGIYDSETQLTTLNPTRWKLGNRLCVIPVDVTIRYGIDLDELTEKDLRLIGEDSIEIRLPKAKVIDKSFIPYTNQDEIVTISTGLRGKVGETTIQQIKTMAFEEVLKQDKAIQQQLSDELTHNTEMVFTSMLTAIGLHPVFIH
ncbi:MAG: DUF4230 domain-containing protein [Bacteroidales bacterium]|nr:DUF4230 domain-containing protein [Bacteroidales bacterium]